MPLNPLNIRKTTGRKQHNKTHSHCPIRAIASINPFMPSGIFNLDSLDRFISYIGGVWLVFLITMFARISELNANNVDPDQMPHSAASNLGLHCLQMSLLLDARLKLVVKTLYQQVLL